MDKPVQSKETKTLKRFTKDDVKKIRELYKTYTTVELGNMYDRRSSVISDIVRNISYKDPEYIPSKFRHTRCKKVAQILEDDLIVVCKGKNNRKTAGGYKWKYYEES